LIFDGIPLVKTLPEHLQLDLLRRRLFRPAQLRFCTTSNYAIVKSAETEPLFLSHILPATGFSPTGIAYAKPTGVFTRGHCLPGSPGPSLPSRPCGSS
jgi:hypothetical protein